MLRIINLILGILIIVACLLFMVFFYRYRAQKKSKGRITEPFEKICDFAQTLGLQVNKVQGNKNKEKYSICKVTVKRYKTMKVQDYYECLYKIYCSYLRKNNKNYRLKELFCFLLYLVPTALLAGAGMLIFSFTAQQHFVPFLIFEIICIVCFFTAFIIIWFFEKRTIKKFCNTQSNELQSAGFPLSKLLENFVFSPLAILALIGNSGSSN